MKNSNHHYPNQGALIGAAIVFALGAPLAMAAEDNENIRERIVEDAKQLQEKMSGLFHDAWKEIRESVDAKSHAKPSRTSASVDVREQNDGYTVRISLPGRDVEKVDVSMVNNQLKIAAPAGEKLGRYEQTLTLDDLKSGVEPQIERKPDKQLIIVRIPKNPSLAETEPQVSEKKPEALPAPADAWDRDILDHMDRMRREMDEAFNRMFKDADGMFDESQFGSSVELKEEDGQYVVRAYLPERDMANVKVNVEDGRILKIDAMSEKSSSGDERDTVMKHKARYLQMLTLPGPVNADQLKVDRRQGMLIITIPKTTKA